MSESLDLEDLVRRIPRGALLAVPPDHVAEVYPEFASAMFGEAA